MTTIREHRSAGPIGVHVRGNAVHALQFNRVNGALRIRARASEPLVRGYAEPGELLDALRRLLSDHPFLGRRVIASLPAPEVEVRPLRLPEGVIPGTPGFEEVFLVEAKASLLYDLREAVLDYLPLTERLPEGERRHTVLLISSRRERVNRFLAAFREAGMNCEHLEMSPCAAARVLGERGVPYAMVDIDGDFTVISIATGQKLLFSRTVKTGFRAWLTHLGDALSISPAMAAELLLTFGIDPQEAPRFSLDDAETTGQLATGAIPANLYEICGGALEGLIREVRRTMDYFALLPGGGHLTEIALFGEMIPLHLEKLFELRLKMEARLGNAGGRELGTMDERASARWAIAAGLAMREN